jgi:5-methylcytosine-specific restriction endonuclease McrBC GTP-binding regulatory subunit McrB
VSKAPNTAELIEEVYSAAITFGHRSIIVLSGVPATGKTYMARQVAERLAESQSLFIKEVQFHAGYTYEDFIQGLRPNAQGGFEWRFGILLDHNENANSDEDPGHKYVVLIEELTRANLSSVLGELLTYVEYRGSDERAFTLPSGQSVTLSDRLVILATMNPRDRSALEMDDALIRRLRIIDCPPSTTQLREMLAGVDDGIVLRLEKFFDDVRAEFKDTFDTAMPFGHGVFKGVASEQDLYLLWKQRLRHILFGPNGPRHSMAEAIESAYPWTSPPKSGAPAPAQAAGESTAADQSGGASAAAHAPPAGQT